MALIPNDVGLRMRTDLDTPLRPIQPLVEIPSELADLRPGQLFSARIQEVLPENSYRALVAGKSITLSLPEGAKAGDTLELVVVDRTPRSVIAQLAAGNVNTASSSEATYPFASLSRTGQLIASLLGADGETPPSAPLTRGQPLLPQGAADAAEIAPQLAKAVGESGVFYESHQAQWVLGQRPLAHLLAEPQAQHSPGQPVAPTPHESTPALPQARAAEPGNASTIARTLLGPGDEQVRTADTAIATRAVATSPLPEEIRPLVQQQLEAAASQRLAWHGEIWPNQTFEWEIERDPSPKSQDDTDPPQWRTSLRLTTPRLGQIDAQLQMGAQGVRIDIAADSAQSTSDLRNAAPFLEGAFAAAGIPLLGIQIREEAENGA